MLHYLATIKANRQRSSKDRRVWVKHTIVSYSDDTGIEYRKSFETKENINPRVPLRGTHDELNALKYQWS